MSMQESPHISLGGQGPLLHFSHANGYPPLAYKAMLDPFLDTHRVIASLHRPLWEPPPEPGTVSSWQTFGNDLIPLLSDMEKPVVSIGHSMGSVAIMMAAVQRPELFSRIVLIEPVLIPKRYLTLLQLFGRFATSNIPLVRKTLARADQWSSKQEAFEHFRSKFVFKDISDEVLWDYVQHGTTDAADGSCSLCYSKQWEAHCYTLVHNLWHLLGKISMPVLAIRGANSNTLTHATWMKWRKISPQHEYLEIGQAGHLVPFEQPVPLALEIKNWLLTRSQLNSTRLKSI